MQWPYRVDSLFLLSFIPPLPEVRYSDHLPLDAARILPYYIADLISLMDQLQFRGLVIVGQDWGDLIDPRVLAQMPDRFASLQEQDHTSAELQRLLADQMLISGLVAIAFPRASRDSVKNFAYLGESYGSFEIATLDKSESRCNFS